MTTDCSVETLQLSHQFISTQVTPNQLVMVIARPNNLYVSCKLHPYSFQRTRSPPPGLRLPKKRRNAHPRNYYTSGQGNRCTYFLFLSKGINIVNWITMTRKSSEHLRTIYGNTGQLFRPYLISSVYRNHHYHHYHHHVALSARISLTLSRHPSLSSIASAKSSEILPE